MRARNKFLLSAVMMTLLSSTMAMPSTWAAAGLNSDGRIFATTADSKFESTGNTTANGVVASDGGQVTIGSLDTPDASQLPKRYRQPAFITGMLNNSSIQVDGGIMDVTTAPWKSPYPVAFAYNSKINLGIDDAGTVKHKVFNMQGDVLVSDKMMPPHQEQQPSVINIGLGRAHNSPNQFSGKAVNTLEDKGGEINMTFDGGMWSHDSMGGLESFKIDGKTERSSINNLTGTRTREGFSRISQDSRSDIHVNKLDGHINVIYDMSDGTGLNFAKQGSKKNGLDPADIEGGNFIVKSATTGSAVHGYVTGDHLDTSSESNVNKILDNLAHKFYYENYVNGERNLSGTVSIASKGIVSSYKKALTTDQKEGDITWKDGNGQGSYVVPEPKPTPTPDPKPVTPVTPDPKPITPVTPDPKPVMPVTPDPKPVTPVTPDPKPVTPVTPDPKPVTPVTPDPKPVTPVTPDPKPVTPVTPDSKPVTPVTPDPKPVTPVTPDPKPVTPVTPNPVVRGAYDTPHMRGIRSAVVGNINAWRTLADDMYRPRVLQQGEPTGIWARIGGGKYSYSGSGIDTATDYTRIQGGYDAKISRGWTVGGQVSYLRGSEDYVFDGSGKVKSFSVGAYGLKDLGKDQYVHVETQVGRVSNDFTARNEIGEAMSGDTKSNAYSIGVRYGKTLKYDNGFYVEPQAQLNFTHFGGRNFNVGNVFVNQSSVNSTSGKIGLELGKQFGNGNLYTRFAAGHAFTGNVKTAFASGSVAKLTEQDLKGTWTELAFGGRYGFNSNNSVFADVATGLSGDLQADWGVNAGFTHKF
ncbi:MAG: autotransporter outer membrane beta-barrel domain-containing protein [Veillonella sp.]|uniref:autotransporter outer membrane beta-barrel domain-containing protein n=1 Tax=Veillonella sp. TaxID=1926307 RepID=UPI002903C07C|nr:autotransporter outer membrane beta-barrel domain-containing protein [Veillonella sp.]MDU0851653.1 autotransporter outer membrane beta-barrel domain-containing protein [Veillonella sp.]MDU1501759.1 autotransporter outer membrane beta-barrel domain-containing protein [Veillonella sp.]MDU1657546.1 autotransporter outer membrane beta-barrel domain-containing protein [Veillonella sp.]